VGPEWNTDEVVDLLLHCGRIAAAAQAQASWTLKRDGSLVTAVDHAVEGLLAARLDRPAAGCFLIGEETVGNRDEGYLDGALAQTAWIVDPVDGTAPFAHGFSYWGVSIGFARAGVIEHGAVFLPATGELFITRGTEVCQAQGVDLHADPNRLELRPLQPRLLPLTDGGMVALGQRFIRTRRFPWPNPVIATGCAVNVLSYLMLGRLMGCIGFMCLWDLAGVLPMLERTGIVARLADGTPLTSRIAGGAFVLGPGRPGRWAQRDQAAFGSPEVVEALVTQVLSPTGGGRPADPVSQPSSPRSPACP
jgi:fructose-1,6-bisphosphatase/inositol monophosphatase family enzyme